MALLGCGGVDFSAVFPSVKGSTQDCTLLNLIEFSGLYFSVKKNRDFISILC